MIVNIFMNIYGIWFIDSWTTNKGGTRQKGAVTDDGPKHAKGDDGGRRPWRRRLIVMGAVAPGGAKASEWGVMTPVNSDRQRDR